jgi:hypothetical protein
MEEGVGSLMDKIQKNLFVCIDRNCGRMDSQSCCCPSIDEFVPDDCDYAIFHPLETQSGIAQRDRQTGKTSALIKVANELARRGHRVYYFTKRLDAGKYLKNKYQLNDNVQVCSIGQIRAHTLRGLKPGFIVADELNPLELDNVRIEFVGSRLVAAYWT